MRRGIPDGEYDPAGISYVIPGSCDAVGKTKKEGYQHDSEADNRNKEEAGAGSGGT